VPGKDDMRRRRNMRLIAKEEAAEAERARRREVGRQALLLKSQGHSLFDIASQLDADEGLVKESMSETMRALADVMDEVERREHLVELLTSAELIQRSMMPAATAGDSRAADTVLKVLDRKAKWLGLEDGNVDARTQTLIVQGTEYAEALRQIAAANNG
jgi:hypothetical protein